ncbi:unnamed protein product [Vicia faba]|uniref:Uncharacterized protein n=1 Tax=Vicia faba TaxID=3906 RepID=A0AAV0ZW77_VICFA|nr:unnamed protein product [Vicia faba]
MFNIFEDFGLVVEVVIPPKRDKPGGRKGKEVVENRGGMNLTYHGGGGIAKEKVTDKSYARAMKINSSVRPVQWEKKVLGWRQEEKKPKFSHLQFNVEKEYNIKCKGGHVLYPGN